MPRAWDAENRDARRDLDQAAEGRATVRLRHRQVFRDACVTGVRLGRLLQSRGWTGALRRAAGGPGPPDRVRDVRKVVVAAAIVRGGRVLAARRTTPPEAAGRWELPGGKAEPGEPLTAALEREVAEELGCEVEVTRWLDGAAPVGEAYELRAALVRVVRGEPDPTEDDGTHDELRWLTADELAPDHERGVDWLAPDRPFLPQIAAALRHSARDTRRIVVFEAEHAEAVEQRLRHDGFDAEVVRERLQGEDDDEDHPWAVVTDAPSLVAEVLTDEYDGWLDEDDPGRTPEQHSPAAGSPLDLPTAPRRIKRTS